MASEAPPASNVTHEDEFSPPGLDHDALHYSKVHQDAVINDSEVPNPLAEVVYNPPIGLSTDEVNRRIIAILTVG
ncbi:hypothetical protein BBBOND_0310130 [Babesia bigemina]|uniref:Uncharacterized protein n=1 Tax=Babesia bigemina TaxID=5866 RepID=A0A061DED9_BABBI|nr:hypothetical protein BBBOND_0310130 [Babesia bigemina]CDR97110.1 hypothetical protein BBBOND_0310130 [Babesia bigemina]|eukprot:XP_012769296.1 hypothetical protein BBBOND_0310130 [Babesia bigemina]